MTVVNDGEASKIGYSTYVKERLDGFGGEGGMAALPADLGEFPDYMARVMGALDFALPACAGPVSYRDLDAVRTDIANLKAAVGGADVEDVFMTAASPGVISVFLSNQHYPSHEEYIAALADAMKAEYDEIHAAGIVLQLDCPDLAMTRHMNADETPRGVPPPREAARRGDQPRDPRHPARGDAHAPLLGQLRGPAPPRRAAARDHRHRLRGTSGGDLVRGGKPAPRARVDGCSTTSSCLTARR